MIELKYPHNISHLVFRGFLAVRAHVGPHQLMLKTINENEFDEIALYSGMSFEDIVDIEDFSERSLALNRFFPWLLAWGTATINGVNAVAFRRDPSWHNELVKTFQWCETSLVQELAGGVQRLQLWYNFELLNVERFAIEPFSRAAWPSYSRAQLNAPDVTGFPGTELLGLNRHQILFKAHLQQWAENQQQEGLWEMAKFLGSFFDGKAVRRIHGQDRVRRNMEKAYEERILEGSATRVDKESIWSELEEELNKQLRGEKDEFDLMIEKDSLRRKLEMLTTRMIQEVYSMKYGRKLVRKDMAVVGYDPRSDLPIGEFSMDEARGRLQEKLKELNEAGGTDQVLEMPSDLEASIIKLADEVADDTFKQMQSKKSPSQPQEPNDDLTNIQTFQEPQEPEEGPHRDPSRDSFFSFDDDLPPGTDLPG